ncbi:hypothetical protein BDN71DRAFT_804215 [Pleurotus eryngii]|uniref:Uncharacterized protein n=1 Tax=Pleurotus eryngii TaxID=5323 RepID=A0A9P5ZF01_PLEER|nr:hypothetical protein BDN71DRAFT_804215 [Pleurotus eryngii]
MLSLSTRRSTNLDLPLVLRPSSLSLPRYWSLSPAPALRYTMLRESPLSLPSPSSSPSPLMLFPVDPKLTSPSLSRAAGPSYASTALCPDIQASGLVCSRLLLNSPRSRRRCDCGNRYGTGDQWESVTGM